MTSRQVLQMKNQSLQDFRASQTLQFLKVFPYHFVFQQSLYHNRAIKSMVRCCGWPGTSVPRLFCTAQPGCFREALLPPLLKLSFREAPLPLQGEPSRVLRSSGFWDAASGQFLGSMGAFLNT